jgi:hypothetical protein
MSVRSDAIAAQAAGQPVDYGLVGKKAVQAAAYPVANGLLNLIPGLGTVFSIADGLLSTIGMSPMKFFTDFMVDLIPNSAFDGLGELIVGKPEGGTAVGATPPTAQAETPAPTPVRTPAGISPPTPARRPPVVTPAATIGSAQADRIVASNTVSQNVERNSQSSVFNIYCKIGDKDVLADVVKVAINDGNSLGGIAT